VIDLEPGDHVIDVELVTLTARSKTGSATLNDLTASGDQDDAGI